ncbi:thioredoxin family protein [Ferrimonas sediminicola]|uniref:Thioredoxin family protein n=1 Tax=Ferrimonas sediminicola TaxID=2569538 RepID=A0A4U1BMH2_9GAMM|nr:thioredoxin family protein [Ferrimonas sediminicola]TKB51328.1 thioredoxin family protein [Ferrimonas sediminicola]
MKIEILGSGCKKCHTLAEMVDTRAKELGLEFQLEHVTDMGRILDYGVMRTPAIVIDGEVKHSGSLPERAELDALLNRG